MHISDYVSQVLVPGNSAVSRLRMNGLYTDPERMKASRIKWEKEAKELEAQVKDFGAKHGMVLTFSAAHALPTKQLLDVLYSPKGLGLPIEKKTPTDQPSTDDGALTKYASVMIPRPDDIPVVYAILKLRSLNKALTTYLGGYERTRRPDGASHPNFNWAKVKTPRLSADSPNTQNIPERADKAVADEIKSWFVPRISPAPTPEEWDPRKHGSSFRWDIAGAEAAIRAACLTAIFCTKPDPIAWEYLRKGKDIHSKTASLIYNKPEGTFKKGDLERDAVGKNTFFAKQFGATWPTVQRTCIEKARLWLPDDEAKRISDSFDKGYSGLTELFEIDKNHLGKYGYCEDGYGRRRKIPMPAGVRYLGKNGNGKARWEISVSKERYKKVMAEMEHAFHTAANCLDAETEALTQRGWIKGFDLQKNDTLLTKNATTGRLEWQGLVDLKLFPDYQGPLVEFKSKSFHAISTPAHRWLVYDRHFKKDVEKTTVSLSQWGDHKIHLTGEYTPEMSSVLSPDEAELMGWWLTDGYLRKKCHDGPRKRRGRRVYSLPTARAFLTQSLSGNPHKCRRIDTLLSRLDRENLVRRYVRKEKRKDTGQQVTGVEWNLGPSFSQKLIALCPNRVLTVHLLCRLDRAALERLRESMILGDGWVDKNTLNFCSGSKEQIEAFQILCTLTGVAASIRWEDIKKYGGWNSSTSPGIWTATVLRRKRAQVIRRQRREFVAAQPVWCPVVPNTFFVARRSNTVFITGNTPTQGMSATDCIWMVALTTLGEYVELKLPPMWRDRGLFFPEAASWTMNGGPGPGGKPLQAWYSNTVHDSCWGDTAPGRHIESAMKVIMRRCTAVPFDWRIKADVPYRVEFKIGPDQAHLYDYNKIARKYGFEEMPST